MNEQTIQRRTVFQGRLLRIEVEDTALADGRRTTRELVRHPGAAVILAQDAHDRFILVRQYRAAVGRELLEAVAGTLDPDEAPETCARRELEEETGCRAVSILSLGSILPAPGYSEEVLHAWYARVEPGDGTAQPDADEAIETVTFTAAEIEAMIAAGEIADAKTLAIWTLYRARGDQLEAATMGDDEQGEMSGMPGD